MTQYHQSKFDREVRGRIRKFWAGLLCLFFLSTFPAYAKIELPLNDPSLRKMPVAIPDFVGPASGPLTGSELATILKNDLYLTGLFAILEPSSIPPNSSTGEPDFDAWSQIGAQALILGTFHVTDRQLVMEIRLYDVGLKRMELGKRFTGDLQDHRQMVHRFGDRVLDALTGVPGCFATRIAFVADTPPKEIFAMDFDGHGAQQITHTNTINLSPEWSRDGRSLLFTSYLRRNPDLWHVDFSNPTPRVVSARAGINASARYSPDGNIIALSLSTEGIPKVFLLTTYGNIIKRLTNGRGNDISPTWSPDGSQIAYVSDHAGTPQIYIAPVNQGEPRRLTFESNYNTDPDWSPRGDLVAFTARVEGRFQVCTVRTDGTDFRVLTGQGANEDPAWSPDGRMIAFTSNRNGAKRIYIMNASGGNQVPVSPIPGKFPAWSGSAGSGAGR
jgi:TolB protein